MARQRLAAKRMREIFEADVSRVIAKFYKPGGDSRVKKILDRIFLLSDKECDSLLSSVLDEFSSRHHDLKRELLENFSLLEKKYLPGQKLSRSKKLLIGAFFTHEYSIESAALFNPSIIPAPDQHNLPKGSQRFIMSFRATGEGHISSLVFRSGIIDSKNNFTLDPMTPYSETPGVELDPSYNKELFLLKLGEIEARNFISERVLSVLSEEFLYSDLEASLESTSKELSEGFLLNETFEIIRWIATSNYQVSFRPDSCLTERVIFPVIEQERNGIEDARFVHFTEEDGSQKYYATYTAYNGHSILPMILETEDFIDFKVCTLNGKAARDKGMALFPRKINGQYAMISRQDGENLFYMQSNNLHFWQKKQLLQTPKLPWELIQIGNCGSPIETKEGWLLLTHGVGALRKYCIGAELLDLKNPSKVIAKLKDPLIMPNVMEREGYVPNVVYTCGALLHNQTLIIPYAMSDTQTGIATVELSKLWQSMK